MYWEHLQLFEWLKNKDKMGLNGNAGLFSQSVV